MAQHGQTWHQQGSNMAQHGATCAQHGSDMRNLAPTWPFSDQCPAVTRKPLNQPMPCGVCCAQRCYLRLALAMGAHARAALHQKKIQHSCWEVLPSNQKSSDTKYEFLEWCSQEVPHAEKITKIIALFLSVVQWAEGRSTIFYIAMLVLLCQIFKTWQKHCKMVVLLKGLNRKHQKNVWKVNAKPWISHCLVLFEAQNWCY